MEIQGDTTTEAQSTQAVEEQTTEQVSNSQQSQETQETQETGSQELGWTDEQKAYIDGLRKENAKYRTRAKELDSRVSQSTEQLSKIETGLKSLFGEGEQDLPPEQQIEALQMQNEHLAVESALKDAAYEYDIGRDSYDYFEFLISKRLGDLEEGDELTEEDLDEIARMAKSRSANSSTSVGTNTSDNPAPQVGEGAVTLDEFEAMSINEKSVLYQKDKALYESLAQQQRTAQMKVKR